MSVPSPPLAPRAAAHWLLRLRLWWALILAAALVGAAVGSEISLPWGWLALCVGLGAASNLPLARALLRGPTPKDAERLPTGPVAAALGLDVVLLMTLLALSGGVHNPFSVLALVQIALAATLLPAPATWALCGLAIAGYGALFWVDGQLAGWLEVAASVPEAGVADCPHCATTESGLSAHLQGMWVGFSIACALVAHFVGRLSAAARDRGRSLLALAESEARQRRLAALSTLAAGAAHELATPLGTIALVAGELERDAAGRSAAELEDLRLLSAEAARCRRILDRMAVGHREGAALAALSAPVRPGEVLEQVRARLSPERGARLRLEVATDRLALASHGALTEAVHCLVDNALDASPPGASVSLRAEGDAHGICFVIEDHGVGMSAELLAHACEPFVTTKAPDQGQGLGLFLVHGFADAARGRLDLRSREGQGTTARLTVPQAPGAPQA